MALAQKRAIAAAKESTVLGAQSKLDDVVGAHLELEVDWNSFAEEDVRNIEHDLPTYGLDQVVQAMTLICADDFGKEAVRENIEKVVIALAKDVNAPELEGKTLNVQIGGQLGGGYFSGERIAEYLEKKL